MKLSIALVYIQMAEIDTVDLSHIASYVVKLDCTPSEIPIHLLDIFHHAGKGKELNSDFCNLHYIIKYYIWMQLNIITL